jgi:hypothetical protein
MATAERREFRCYDPLGGMIGYTLGVANFEAYVTDSVYTRDDFSGPSIFTRLSFKLWRDEPPAAG